MVAILATALLVVVTSLVAGMALLRVLGRRESTPVAAAVGFAALTVACPILIRLPGRAATTAVLVGLGLVAAAGYLWASRRRGAADGRGRVAALPAIATTVVVLALACVPFGLNDSTGVLGQGIYTNDQAAQLYWTDWLQNGFGPEPSAVRFGYPTGPQSVTAAAAEATGATLEEAFNGLLVAIPALAALAALAALRDLPPVRRVVAASLVGLPYLGASFLAQSAFKETAMALFVLTFAVVLEATAEAGALGRRPGVGALALLAAASVFTYSVPGLAWFAAGLAGWAVLEVLVRRRTLPLAELRAGLAGHRRALLVGGIIVVVIAALGAGQASSFISKIGDVQGSTGRLDSPVFPGEALGIWPEGDFRLVRGDVAGAVPATLLGLLALGAGAFLLLRRRRLALAGMLGGAAAVYVGARLFASIYVEAKALAVMAPLVVLVALAGLLAPSRQAPAGKSSPGRLPGLGVALRLGLGTIAAVGLAVSTLLALRAAPVGFDDRGEELEALGSEVQGKSVAFLGVDRFGGYRLRGTLVESPGGYVPAEVRARPEKTWQQGLAMDLDTLAPSKLDRFDYAITTSAAFQSSPPPNMRVVDATSSFVLWRRTGPTPRLRVLHEGGDPGRMLRCAGAGGGAAAPDGSATVWPEPVLGGPLEWSLAPPFTAPATAEQRLDLGPGRWQLSLQYVSQVPLTAAADGAALTELPASLDGMYLTHQGEGSWWPLGEVTVSGRAATAVSVEAAEPNGLQRALGVDRRVWLGGVAATRVSRPREQPMARSCDSYVDHFLVGGRGPGPAG